MNIREQESQLFARWEKRYEGLFIKDGVPCPEQYISEETKITFVLKEANAEGESWDMREWVNRYGGRHQTWNNIARWTQAILEGGEYPKYISKEYRIRWLKRISFLNLKKSGGGRSSNYKEIQKHAEDNAGLILEQLKIYQPEIIMCCGINFVAYILKDFIFNYRGEWEHYPEAYDDCYCFRTEALGKTTVVLNAFHPLNLGTGKTNLQLYEAITKVAPKLLRIDALEKLV